MNTFEDTGFDAGNVLSTTSTLSEFERKVYSEVMMFFLNENADRMDAGRTDFVKFKDEAEMFSAYWAAVLEGETP